MRMRTRLFLGLAALTLIVAGASQTRAATYHVDSGWTGASSGTAAAPFHTIAEAAALVSASSGHTVKIAGGRYASIGQGGLENFGTAGYNLGTANNHSARIEGGYGGWQGGTTFDWTSRTLPVAGALNPSTMTVIDLVGANSRAFTHGAYQQDVRYSGLAFVNSNVTQANYKGGAIYAGGGYKPTGVADSVFENNRTTGDGGAVYMSGRGGSLERVVFKSNTAGKSGGGVYYIAPNGNVYIKDSVFEGNSALGTATQREEGGGGAYVKGAIVTNTLFKDNSAVMSGGGIESTDNTGPTTVRGSVFVGNSANKGGAIGGAQYQGPKFIIENSLIYGNTSNNYAVYAAGANNAASITMRYTTVADNTGGGVLSIVGRTGTGYMGQIDIANSIIANNGAIGIRTDDLVPMIDYNDVYGHTTNYHDDGTGTVLPGANDISLDPQFVDALLADYRILLGSPVIGAWPDLSILIDLLGDARPGLDGLITMGAYETLVEPETADEIPEPATMALLVVGAAAVCARRRRR